MSSLEAEGIGHEVERTLVRKHGEERRFTHVHVRDRFPFELTVYPADKAHSVFKSSVTGGAIERASIAQLEETLSQRLGQWPGDGLFVFTGVGDEDVPTRLLHSVAHDR